LEEGYADEIDWQYTVSIDRVNEEIFLREAAWVILSSGMHERVVRQRFPAISDAFFNWKSALVIIKNAEACRSHALHHFRNSAKIDAILAVADHVGSHGLEHVVDNLLENGIEYLQQFPYIGPATSYHLAKNIGVMCAKPDRHLCRIANKLGYNCVQQLCIDISNVTDEPVPVIDSVLWRYATLHHNYLELLSELVSTLQFTADQ
jgi:hypothetical protein